MLRKITFTLALILSLTQLTAQVKFHDVSTDELRKIAIAEKKLVFIDIYATWCPPCRQMDKTVFSRADVGEFMSKNFVSAKYDIDKPTGREIANKYGVKSIPTYLIFDTEGNLVDGMQGAMPHEDFVGYLKKLLKK